MLVGTDTNTWLMMMMMRICVHILLQESKQTPYIYVYMSTDHTIITLQCSVCKLHCVTLSRQGGLCLLGGSRSLTLLALQVVLLDDDGLATSALSVAGHR